MWLSGRLPQRALQFAIIYLRLCSNEDIYLFAFRGNAVPDVPAIAWIYALHTHTHTRKQASLSQLVCDIFIFICYLSSFDIFSYARANTTQSFFVAAVAAAAHRMSDFVVRAMLDCRMPVMRYDEFRMQKIMTIFDLFVSVDFE